MKKLTNEEIEIVTNSFIVNQKIYFDDDMSEEIIETFKRYKILNKIKDSLVIEIGCGNSPFCKKVECGSYIGIDLLISEKVVSKKERYIKNDALSFLKNQKNNSAIIVSFGVFNKEIMRGLIYKNRSLIQLRERYIQELVDKLAGVKNYKFIDDKDYNLCNIGSSNYKQEYKPHDLTTIINGMQVNNYIVQPWQFLIVEKE